MIDSAARHGLAAIANLGRTPEGLTDIELLARYRAASILAEAHGVPVSAILGDWFPAHLSRFEDMDVRGEGMVSPPGIEPGT
jgi:hypothetical protein